ncbi:hypothetical protein BS47DRAFT_1336580 [Hydnum rufescens UP504]|uniref:Uncharacterized protein n=1 Tax=Hydnum rufescens UP504 TaxID=1448309 RepID=A0A9P6B8R8_9AGAM|nr:hypothetical protein BS47DRAFT_1336580 [Hydnum rufescens UP504]
MIARNVERAQLEGPSDLPSTYYTAVSPSIVILSCEARGRPKYTQQDGQRRSRKVLGLMDKRRDSNRWCSTAAGRNARVLENGADGHEAQRAPMSSQEINSTMSRPVVR